MFDLQKGLKALKHHLQEWILGSRPGIPPLFLIEPQETSPLHILLPTCLPRLNILHLGSRLKNHSWSKQGTVM
jgi:hypothetical protein